MTATTSRPPTKRTPPPPAPPARKAVQFGKIRQGAGHRIVLYGPGGIGKTTLASALPGPAAFVDLDDSLPRLAAQLDTGNILPVAGVESWSTLRDALHADGWQDVKSIVIDTGTRAEEMAVAHTLASVPHEKGHPIRRSSRSRVLPVQRVSL